MSPRPDLLFRTATPDILAEKLAYYMRNPAERQHMRDWGSEYVKLFDVNAVGNKLLNIYYQALRKRRGA
jgi:glycosyltransferase involved in cell wall biosynthesis